MDATFPIRITVDLDADAPYEQFVAVALDRSGEWLGEARTISRFGDRAAVDQREIFGMALRHEAFALLVAHTHPSGDPRPSRSDIDATRSIAQLCAGLGIHLADHVIVARGGQFSFREAGLL
jgi:DNA repair protein RadC